jgi:phosphoadenosine phosphosulfate reductase
MESNTKEILEKEINESKEVIRKALEKYDLNDLAVAWTGGKDSTFLFWLIKQVFEEKEIGLPEAFCIDEGDMFNEVKEFLKEVSNMWDVKLLYLHNSDVSKASGGKIGAIVKVAILNNRNRKEIERIGYQNEEFTYEPESFIGNHLMKTVVLNEYLEKANKKAFFEGIRWDEQISRSNESYFSPRPATEFSPEHTRICPILHFTERNIWEAVLHYNVPFCPLYRHGYRSLGACLTTTKNSNKPAWEQDLENTDERSGRRQDKEHLMEKLRKLGYM